MPLQGFLNAIVYGWTREDFIHVVTLQLTARSDFDESTPIIVNPQELCMSYDAQNDGRFEDTVSQMATSGESESEY